VRKLVEGGVLEDCGEGSVELDLELKKVGRVVLVVVVWCLLKCFNGCRGV